MEPIADEVQKQLEGAGGQIEKESAHPPTVVEALALVMDEVQAVGKEGRNTQQNYNFRGIDAVVNAVGPAFRKHGVVCVPVSVDHQSEHYTTRSGTQMRGVTLLVGFRFYGPRGDYIEACAAGESSDSGDKATPKAHSVAYRTMLLQALCIPTDEPDPDQESHERAERRVEGLPAVPVPSSWPKVEQAVRLCDNESEAWALWEAFLRAATYHLYGKISLKEIETAQRQVMLQKAGGAAVWMIENAKSEGPGFTFFDEDLMRLAWAAMLGGSVLEIPDYTPLEPPGADEALEAAAEEAEQAAISEAEAAQDDHLGASPSASMSPSASVDS